MKKYLFLLLCVPAIVGCTTKNVTEVVYRTTTVSYVYQVDTWNYSNLSSQGSPFANNYFYAKADFPELTADVCRNANIQVYRVRDGYQHVLPEVQHYEQQIDAENWNFYTQTVDCIYGPGWIEFDVTHSDFEYESDLSYVPEAMQFRVVITE